MKYFTLIISCAALLIGCASDSNEKDKDDGHVSTQPQAIRLKPIKDCTEVESFIREAAMIEMSQRLDTALEQALQNKGQCPYPELDMAGGAIAAGAPTSGSGENGGTSSSAKNVSKTNNQVAGVDEADFVKNDNKYVYILAEKSFRIIDAWPPVQANELAKVVIDGQPRKLFIENDFALIYSSLPLENVSNQTSPDSSSPMPGISRPYQQKECTYGYNCSFTGDGHPTKITILDISNKSSPKLVRELTINGSYVNARRIGEAVFTVISAPGIQFPGLKYYPESIERCNPDVPKWQIELAFSDLRVKNAEIINTTKLDGWLPAIKDTIHSGAEPTTTENLLDQCQGFYRSSITDGAQFTTLLALNMTQTDAANTSTILSRPGAVYASSEGLYIAVPHQQQHYYGWYPGMEAIKEATTIHRFKLETASPMASYTASGIVKGRVLNQFSMDEHNKSFRVATTTGHLPSPDVHSTLTILQQKDKSLTEVGILDKLAPQEDIRSMRFDGDRGFMVTFKKTDPLFIFDLSEPTSPKVLSELKIPGFSTYMHMMDDNHVLSIGYDADDQKSFAWFTGVMLQIFDVTDPKKPERIHKEVIGTRGSSSDALTNHLAFNYFAPKDLLAFPITVCEGSSGGGTYGNEMTFSGLMVYNTTAVNGFKLKGKVAHPAGQGVTCGNWWTNANSQVKRSIFMDDYVLSISHSLIKFNHLDDLSTDIKELTLSE